MKSFLACLCCFLLVSVAARSQSYYFRHYQVEQGLSNNTVFSCQQDKRGFLWMGTKDGLNRFDGYSFKVFRNDVDDSTSIGDNFIRSMLISEGDTLYAGTRNGLYRYNARLENFSSLYRGSEEVRDIRKDRHGNLWFIAGQTLHWLRESDGRQKQYPPSSFFAATSVCIDPSGGVWVSTSNGYLCRYDEDTDSFKRFDVFDPAMPASIRWIEKIYASTASTILIGTSNSGVKSFDIKQGTWKDLLTLNPDRTAIFARDFVQTPDNTIWIATESGIFVYDPGTGKAENLRKQSGNPYTLSDNAVYSLCRDREGGTWAGTYFGGINYFPRQQVSFEKYFPGDDTHPLSGYAVREICEDSSGHLWIGTEDAGLNRLDKKTGAIRQYRPDGNPGSISYSNIHGMLVKGRELWVGTFEHGLDILDLVTGKVVKRFPGNSAELRSNFIVVLYRTRTGLIYIGTRHGLYRFDERLNEFNLVKAIPAETFIHTITEDVHGVLWVGTLGNGLYYLRPGENGAGHFDHDPKNRKSLSSNSVTTLFESADRQLWIGTEGGGLDRFIAADSSFAPYTTRQGFPSNTIFKVLEDDSHKLWITTANGLLCFEPATAKLAVYTTAHGLLSNQFNYNSGYRDADGMMYFGSAKGMVSFDPDNFRADNQTSPVYITGLYVNDNEQRPLTAGSPLRNAVSFTEEVELNYDGASFSIEFAALSFAAPEMTEYMYTTDGLDKEWTYLKTNRKVYFTNLSPGVYTFRVKARNAGGDWPETASSIIIRILPPFWASPVAYTVYAILALLLALLIIRFYHHRVREKTRRKIETLEREKEKEIYQAKIDFFTNVAHEIKTPLTLVKAPMEQIAKKAGGDANFAYDLHIMQRNTDRLVELTNQLLDFRKVEANGFYLSFVQTNISQLLRETGAGFELLARQKKVAFELLLPELPVLAFVDVDALEKILNNLFYNAINYCRESVWIELSARETGYFTIEVRNDGTLVPDELKERIFEPFYRLQQHRDRSGTGIGLALARSLAELHKGSIRFHSADGVNVFRFSLPMNQESD
ncbi:MAG: sensor histidine kinase [Chitinophagaceae bacterium]|nr:MAG: sensor histidine kinase [Chitinophagaceae bacterium]